jgi:hypothetical protein
MRLLSMVRANPELSPSRFAATWRGVEDTLREHATLLGIQRYEQLVTARRAPLNPLLRLLRGTRRAFAGASSLWVDGERFRTMLATEPGRQAWREVLRREAQAVDFTRSPQWVVREHLLRKGTGRFDDRPLLWAGRGLAALDDAAFRHHYLEQHGPLVAARAELLGFDRYLQLHRVDDPLDAVLLACRESVSSAPCRESAFPVAAEVSWHTRGMFRRDRLRDAKQARREVAEDEQRHIDFSRSVIWTAQRRVLLDLTPVSAEASPIAAT